MTSKTFVPDREFERRKAEAARKADRYIGRDGGQPSPEAEQALDELGALSPAEYGRRRGEMAEVIGTTRAFLDEEYKERRKAGRIEGDGGFLCDPDPWPEPVDGNELLNQIRDAAKRHLVLPDGGAEIIALWATFAHCYDCFDVHPILVFTSPTPECGKSTGMAFVSKITPRALSASNIRAPALYRTVDKWRPTLLIDEAETFVCDTDELRGIINSGHSRSGAFVIRTTGDNHEPKQFSTWSPKVIALIGKLPPTLASRSIQVQLKRMLAGDRIEPLREGRTQHLEPLLQNAARWAADNAEQLRSSEPRIPDALYGRAADNWRPLRGPSSG